MPVVPAAALPLTVAKLKVTPPAGAAADRVTVKVIVLVPELPSFWETLAIDSVGKAAVSLSLMVPTPSESPMVALVALLRLTLKRSVDSTAVSLIVVTAKVWVVVPGLNVTVTLVRAV